MYVLYVVVISCVTVIVKIPLNGRCQFIMPQITGLLNKQNDHVLGLMARLCSDTTCVPFYYWPLTSY